MATNLFQVIAELHILLDQQVLTASSPFTRDTGVVFIQRSQRIYSLLQYLNTRSVEKLTALDQSSIN
jgi:hypothetical protein